MVDFAEVFYGDYSCRRQLSSAAMIAINTGQNVYNYAARYNVGLTFARDGILMSTITSPVFIAIIAALLS